MMSDAIERLKKLECERLRISESEFDELIDNICITAATSGHSVIEIYMTISSLIMPRAGKPPTELRGR
jgi:hypothetical protein